MSRPNHRLGLIVPAAAIAGALLAASAQADPIVVTSGNLNFFVFDSISTQLNGNNAELNAQLAGPGAVPPYACGAGCGGRTLNLSVSDSFPSADGNLVEGVAIVDGIRYALDSFLLDITAGSIVVPPIGSESTSFSFLATAIGTS